MGVKRTKDPAPANEGGWEGSTKPISYDPPTRDPELTRLLADAFVELYEKSGPVRFDTPPDARPFATALKLLELKGFRSLSGTPRQTMFGRHPIYYDVTLVTTGSENLGRTLADAGDGRSVVEVLAEARAADDFATVDRLVNDILQTAGFTG